MEDTKFYVVALIQLGALTGFVFQVKLKQDHPAAAGCYRLVKTGNTAVGNKSTFAYDRLSTK